MSTTDFITIIDLRLALNCILILYEKITLYTHYGPIFCQSPSIWTMTSASHGMMEIHYKEH